jgi:hypothetical protein
MLQAPHDRRKFGHADDAVSEVLPMFSITLASNPHQDRTQSQIPRVGLLAGALALLLLTLLLTLAPPATAATLSVADYGARGDGATDDTAAFRAALAAARSGDTVQVPPATYRIQDTLKPPSGVTLAGSGATLHMPDKGSTDILLDVDGTSGITLSGLSLRSDSVNGGVIGIGAVSEGAQNLTVQNLETRNLYYGMKLGSSGSSRNLQVRGWVGRGDSQSLYMGNVRGGSLSNLDFACYTSASWNNHNIYLEKGNQDLAFSDVRLAGGSGYSLHLYHGSSAQSDWGRNISFRRLHLANPVEGVVVERYDGVSFSDLTGSAQDSQAFFVIYTMSNLTVDGFQVAGTPAAFLASTKNGPITNVTLRDGTYSQPELLKNSGQVTGLVVTGVQGAGAPPTTTTAPAPTFSDVAASHPYAAEIARLAERGIVVGLPDGSFRPEEPVSRQQFAKMILLTLGLGVSEQDRCTFADVACPPDDLYPDNYVAVAAREQITVGMQDGSFAPGAPITRAQVISMVVRAARTRGPSLLGEPAAGSLTAWGPFSPEHQDNVALAAQSGLLDGLDLGQLNPWEGMSRGEAAFVLCQLSDRLLERTGPSKHVERSNLPR